MGRTGVDRNTSGDTCVSFAAWPTSAAGSSISGFFPDKPGVTCDGGGGLLFKEVEAVFSRTGVDRNTSGELSGGSVIMGKNGEEQFKKAEAPCSRTGGSSVSVAAWPTSAAGSSITSGSTGGGAYFPDKPGVSCDGGGGLQFKEAEGLFARAGVDRNTSGKLSGVSGFLGKGGEELDIKKEETPCLRTGGDRNTSGDVSVSNAAWPTSAAGSSVTSVCTGGSAFFLDKPGVSGDGGGGSLFMEAKAPFSRTGVDRNTSGERSGGSGFLGGEELKVKKAVTPTLRTGKFSGVSGFVSKDGEELEYEKEGPPFSRTGVDRNTSGELSVLAAVWPTSAAGLRITSVCTGGSAIFLDKPGVSCDGGGGMLCKEAEALVSRTGVDRNTSGVLSGGSGIMGKNGEELFQKAEAPCSRTGVGRNTSGKLSGGSGCLGKDGEELEFKKEETPMLRTGVDRNTSGDTCVPFAAWPTSAAGSSISGFLSGQTWRYLRRRRRLAVQGGGGRFFAYRC